MIIENHGDSPIYVGYLGDQKNAVKILPVKKEKKMKVAIIIGHNAIDQGAKTYNGYTEFSWNLTMAVEFLPELQLFWREPGLYRQSVYDLAEEISLHSIDLCIELHLNAFDGKTKIQRAEALYLPHDIRNIASEKMANTWEKEMISEYSLTPYPVNNYSIVTKQVGADDRGYYNLKSLADEGIPSVILEPAFADTPNALAENVVENPERYAKLLTRCIETYKEQSK